MNVLLKHMVLGLIAVATIGLSTGEVSAQSIHLECQLINTGFEHNASGDAAYEMSFSQDRFAVHVHKLLNTGFVEIWVDGVLVGMANVDRDGSVEMAMQDTPVTFPVIGIGSIIEVREGKRGNLLMWGMFDADISS